MFLKKIFISSFLFLSACGFSPLYVDSNENEFLSQIEVASIPEYNGYVLKQHIENALNPQKKNNQKKYVLKVNLKSPVLSDQSIQGDNFASRKKVTMTADYQLLDKDTRAVLLSSSTRVLGGYNVFHEPYTTYQAEKKQVSDLVIIIANNISTRVAAYFKKKEIDNESQTVTD